MAAAKKPAARKPAAKKAPPTGHRIATEYEEIPFGDGVLRAEPGYAIVDTADGPLVMPPERFAEYSKGK